MSNTIPKMLNPNNALSVKYLVATLGRVRKNTLESVKTEIRSKLPDNQSFLCISWIGEKRDGDFEIEGWVRNNETESKCAAHARIDEAGFWYLWQEHDWI